MGGGFVPHRRDVAYMKGVREALIAPLASKLQFIRSRPNWGTLARRGHFEITLADLCTIAAAMGAPPGTTRDPFLVWVPGGPRRPARRR